jgi:coenzyme F420-0:L-glutamate ligase/coenzyme F420-1:gamma-L-glutamate ligase
MANPAGPEFPALKFYLSSGGFIAVVGTRTPTKLERIEILSLGGIPEVTKGADLPGLIFRAAKESGTEVKDGDVFVVKQKVVSKAEGRVVPLAEVTPSRRARSLAAEHGKDPRLVELILKESVRVVRAGHGVIITETRHGFVCANSGIDQSNVGRGFAALLPLDPDRSARRIRRGLEAATGKKLAVIVTDTFGRPWRRGQTDVAIGCSGIAPLLPYEGRKDSYGYELRVTEPAVVDEIAGAAELATGKLDGIPAAIVRGAKFRRGEAGAKSLVMPKQRDLFR